MGAVNSISRSFDYNTRQEEINKNKPPKIETSNNERSTNASSPKTATENIAQENYLNKFRYLFDILNQYTNINIYDSKMGDTNKDILAKLTNINKKQKKQAHNYNDKYYTQKNIYKQNQSVLQNEVFINRVMKYSNIILVLFLFGMLVYKMSSTTTTPSSIIQQN
tara:strand:+ start:448 stop:942 length:495 start_codon:yes stop_codon:yes gene_type:complete